MPDISATLAPDSQQLDAVDLLGQERVFTITRVDVKQDQGADQPLTIHLAEFPRPWKPGKSMRRVLAFCYGTKTEAWINHQVLLFCDESVTFGNDVVGGVRIRALSHIDGVKKIPLLVSRGRSATYEVRPLVREDLAPPPAAEPQALPERIEAAVAAYARASVTVPMLEARLALPMDQWAEQNVADLEALYARLVARETTKEAEFDMQAGADA